MRNLLIIMVLFLVGCVSDEAPQKPEQGQAKVGGDELFIALDVKVKTKIDLLPNMVYVFPPILVDEHGRTKEELTYIEKPNGSIEWRPPTQISANLQAAIQKEFANYGYTVVNFERVSNMRHAHEILIVNPYYSPPIRNVNQPNSPLTLVTRLLGSTYPMNLDPDRQTIRFDQNTKSFFPEGSNAFNVVVKNFNYCIQNIGMKVGLETTKEPLTVDES